jgi:hypothetical protein
MEKGGKERGEWGRSHTNARTKSQSDNPCKHPENASTTSSPFARRRSSPPENLDTLDLSGTALAP